MITNIGYEVLYPAGLRTNPTSEHPTRARTRGATGEFTIRRLSEGTATGGLAVTPSDEVYARSLWVFFPYQYGTPYCLQADEQPLTIDGDIDLGDVELSLRTGRGLTICRPQRSGVVSRAGSSRDEPARRGQAAPPPMLTIQLMPNLSVIWPNSSPQTCFSSGTVTVGAVGQGLPVAADRLGVVAVAGQADGDLRAGSELHALRGVGAHQREATGGGRAWRA